jgi:hypothetical protein
MPSSSIERCGAVSATVRVAVTGDTNGPRFVRLENRHRPLAVILEQLDQIAARTAEGEHRAGV